MDHVTLTTALHRPRRARRALLIAGLASALLLLGAVGAGRAQAQQAQFQLDSPGGIVKTDKQYFVQPWYDIIVTWGEPGRRWYQSVDKYVGPKGFTYRMYRNENGNCLDVKQGAATAGAELTTAPCDWWRYSQWWAFNYSGGKLYPWHAADKALVATNYSPGGWQVYRLVLAPASGVNNPDQGFHRDGFCPPGAYLVSGEYCMQPR